MHEPPSMQLVRTFDTKDEAGRFMVALLGESGAPPPEQAIAGESWAAKSVSSETFRDGGYLVTATLFKVQLVERKGGR